MSNNNFTILIIPYNVTQANDWPQVFDDSLARKDWGWSHQTGIDDLCEVKFLSRLYIGMKSMMLT